MVGLQRSVSELLQSLWLWICMNCMTRTLGAMISRAPQDLEMLPDTSMDLRKHQGHQGF